MKYPSYLVESIFNTVIDNATTTRKTSGRMVLRGRCPKCGDSKKKKSKARFYCLEDRTHWTVHCHNCGYTTNFESMLESFFPDQADSLKMMCFSYIKSGEIFKHKTEERVRISPTKEVHIFIDKYFKKNCIPLTTKNSDPKKEKFRKYAYKKMKSRNIPERFLDNFLFCYKGEKDLVKYVWRVIIPFMTKDGMYYNFQARDIHPEPNEARLNTKYLFAEFGDRIQLPDDKIYRQFQTSKNRTVYICEGILDCLFIDNAIALCNANVTGEKSDFIKDNYPDRVWVLDSPWTDKTGYERACKLLEDGESCFIMPKKYKMKDGSLPKDINDLALLLNVESIPNNIINNNILTGKSGLVKLKVGKMGTKWH